MNEIISENKLSKEAAINLLKYVYEYVLPNIPDEDKDRILEKIKREKIQAINKPNE